MNKPADIRGSRIVLVAPTGKESWRTIAFNERAAQGLSFGATGTVRTPGGAQYRIVQFDGEDFTRRLHVSMLRAEDSK